MMDRHAEAREILNDAADEIERLRVVFNAYEIICAAFRVGRRPPDDALDCVRSYKAARAAGGENG